ncbi:MAG: polysaccharide biosynthesis C-terminal domain-containing protein [Oscillospiraceae bacterium]|nr:polysaccharide biosynthesis C-terminal domain-containing protein [Oscillospiraceae bacterium]
MSTKKTALAGSVVLLVSVVISRAAGLLLKIPLTNLLGGTGIGYYSGAYAVFMPLYSLCAGSLSIAVAQMVSESSAFGNKRRMLLIRKLSVWFFGAAGLILTLIPLLFSEFIANRLIGIPEAKLSIMAISPCVFLGTITAILRGYYEDLGDMTPSSVSQTVDAIVKLIVGLGLSMAVRSYALGLFEAGQAVFGVYCSSEAEALEVALPVISCAAVLGTTAADLSGMLSLILFGKFRKDRGIICENPERAEKAEIIKRLVKLCAPISLASVVSSLLGTIDLSTIVMLIGNSLRKNPELYISEYAQVIESGVSLKDLPSFLYGSFTGLSMSIFTLAPSLCAVFGRSAFPSVSENNARGNKEAVSKEIRRVMCLSLYISIPAGMGLCLYSEEILSLIFPSRMAEVSVSAKPLAILATSTAFMTVLGSACSMLQALGRTDIPLKINLGGAILKLALNMVFIPGNPTGLSGAAMATVVSYFVMCILSVVALYRLTGTKPKLSYSVIIPSLLGAISCFSSTYIYKYALLYLSGAVSLMISVIFAIITYILMAELLDITYKNRIRSQFFY